MTLDNARSPFVVPFSKTANLAATIIKKHYTKLKNYDEFDVLTLMLSQPTPGIKIYLIIWYIANYAE